MTVPTPAGSSATRGLGDSAIAASIQVGNATKTSVSGTAAYRIHSFAGLTPLLAVSSSQLDRPVESVSNCVLPAFPVPIATRPATTKTHAVETTDFGPEPG